MIISIDHVAVCTESFTNTINQMKKNQFSINFCKKDIPNLLIKRDFMHNFSNTQSIALMKSINGYNVEILSYDKYHNTHNQFFPIFTSFPYSKSTIKNYLDTFDQISQIKNCTSFDKIIYPTVDIYKSSNFWKYFGFNIIMETKDYLIMNFKDPFRNQNLQIHLVFSRESIISKLDDIGFNCIAFFSNSIHDEKQFLLNNGIKTSEIEKFEIDGKNLLILFGQGPSGELFEIISQM